MESILGRKTPAREKFLETTLSLRPLNEAFINVGRFHIAHRQIKPLFIIPLEFVY